MRSSITKLVQYKPTGKWYWMEVYESWGKIYYSFNRAETWHRTRKEAFEKAQSANQLNEANK